MEFIENIPKTGNFFLEFSQHGEFIGIYFKYRKFLGFFRIPRIYWDYSNNGNLFGLFPQIPVFPQIPGTVIGIILNFENLFGILPKRGMNKECSRYREFIGNIYNFYKYHWYASIFD